MELTFTVQFHNAALPGGERFGILTVKTAPGAPVAQPRAILFGLDRSGSMDDRCADGRTKIQHATHTTKNLYRMLAERAERVEGVEGLIAGVYAFDDKIQDVLPLGPLTPAVLPACLQKIDAIAPCGGTNIERALRHATSCIDGTAGGRTEVTHIFMTDGNATEGRRDPGSLVKLVDPRAQHIFIGYGLDHSARCLAALGAQPGAGYYFIDQIEKGGLAFGEIFHKIFYTRYTGLTLEGQSGSGDGGGFNFYDFRTDTWVARLPIDGWTTDTEKTYHFRYAAGDAQIVVSGVDKALNVTGVLATVAISKSEAGGGVNLQSYLFRQRTQELLFQAQKLDPEVGLPDQWPGRCIKTELKSLLAEIKAYMAANALTEDPLLTSLCDDIVITRRTFGTAYGYMFAVGRINSNGQERAYNICGVPPRVRGESSPLRSIGRSCSVAPARVRFTTPDAADAGSDVDGEGGLGENLGEDPGEDDGHTLSHEPVFATRVTPSMGGLMRSASLY